LGDPVKVLALVQPERSVSKKSAILVGVSNHTVQATGQP
jgi:hypothetical protein